MIMVLNRDIRYLYGWVVGKLYFKSVKDLANEAWSLIEMIWNGVMGTHYPNSGESYRFDS